MKKALGIIMIASVFGFIFTVFGIAEGWLSKWFTLLAAMFYMCIMIPSIHTAIDLIISEDE